MRSCTLEHCSSHPEINRKYKSVQIHNAALGQQKPTCAGDMLWNCLTLYLHDSSVGCWCYKLISSSQWGAVTLWKYQPQEPSDTLHPQSKSHCGVQDLPETSIYHLCCFPRSHVKRPVYRCASKNRHNGHWMQILKLGFTIEVSLNGRKYSQMQVCANKSERVLLKCQRLRRKSSF